jgi:hypothetical protein
VCLIDRRPPLQPKAVGMDHGARDNAGSVARCAQLRHNVIVGHKEESLSGTNVSAVARVGGTLRRPKRPSSEAVQSLLRHLRGRGFTGCPEPLGFDDQGREALSYVQGTGGAVPLRPETVTDRTLVEMAKLIRDFHAVATGFDDVRLTWNPLLRDPSGTAEVICHNDLSIPNTVFRDGQPIALVDWDFAAPGRRLWDLSYAIWWMVPLHRPEFMRSIGWPNDVDQPRRLAMFLDAYGLDEGRADLFDVLHQRQHRNQQQLTSWVAEGKIPSYDSSDPAVECGVTDYIDAIRPTLERAIGL